ncbi:hypothetical protein [Pontibacter sp. SGAir0037]|nr:hypothetical protein [Pontibacter sp. SGAir0037]
MDIGILRIRSEADQTLSGIYFSQWRNQDGKWMIENEMHRFDK